MIAMTCRLKVKAVVCSGDCEKRGRRACTDAGEPLAYNGKEGWASIAGNPDDKRPEYDLAKQNQPESNPADETWSPKNWGISP
jgi:hypothetical protein